MCIVQTCKHALHASYLTRCVSGEKPEKKEKPLARFFFICCYYCCSPHHYYHCDIVIIFRLITAKKENSQTIIICLLLFCSLDLLSRLLLPATAATLDISMCVSIKGWVKLVCSCSRKFFKFTINQLFVYIFFCVLL